MLSHCGSRTPRYGPTRRTTSTADSAAAAAARAPAPGSAGRRRGVPVARGAARRGYRLRAGRLERLGNNVARVHNAFGALDEATRPPPTGALTFLLVGTDSRSEHDAGRASRRTGRTPRATS